MLKEEQQRTGVKLLWGTANLFGNPRYVHGAATSCNADVFAYRRRAGEEGPRSDHRSSAARATCSGAAAKATAPCWNTDMKRELDHLAAFLHMAVDYEKQIGFKGQFYIEPKPKEPTKHQYDFDAAACINFLRDYGLRRPRQAEHRDQPRHAGRPHRAARAGSTPAPQGVLGSIDANTGDLLLGWDTDQFPTDVYLTTKIMLMHPRSTAASPPAA